jgi:glyoxylase-like metal-dependent hydrolase (beta-lactamase superfamily II)
MKLTHLVIVAWLFVGGLTATADAQPGTLKQIVPGVWFREGETRPGTRVVLACNNIVIEMEDYLIVVDANFPSGARAIISDAKKVSSKPIRYVIDTHHHRDHAYGNSVFTKLGATTIGYVGIVEEMKRYEPQRWQHEIKVRKDVAELNLPGPEPPQRTFSESPYIISDSIRRVELYYFGWAHTRGDTFVYLPKEKVLCTGDVVVNGPYITTTDANIANWPNVIRAAQKLDVAYVLPAHGEAGSKELLEGQIRFFEELHKAVAAAIQEGKRLEQLVTMKDGQPLSTSVQLPESVRHWVSLQPWKFPLQVTDTYEEIAQGKPHGKIVGGK